MALRPPGVPRVSLRSIIGHKTGYPMRAKRNKSREKYSTASRTSVRKQVYIRHPLDRYVTGAAAIEALFSVLRRNASFASVKCAVDICGGILDPVSPAITSEVPSARVPRPVPLSSIS